MKFKEFCDNEGIIEDERNKFREFVADDKALGLPEGTDVDNEDIEEDAFGEMYEEFTIDDASDEDEYNEDFRDDEPDDDEDEDD